MYKGTVGWFDEREGKMFGFVICDSYADETSRVPTTAGKEYFFHYNDGEFVVAGEETPVFSGSASRLVKGKRHVLRVPQRDDTIVFKTSMGSRGYKACPWGYISQYESALQVIARRIEAIANSPVYRVRESMASWGKTATPENPGDAKVLWEGQDLADVMRRFPLPSGSQSPGADPLLPFYSHDDGFEVRRWWEVKKENGEWEHCPDPRPLPGVLRQFERITHRFA